MRPALLRLLLVIFAVSLLASACDGKSSGTSTSPSTAPTKAATTTGQRPASVAGSAPTDDPKLIAARMDVPVLCFHQVRDWRASDSSSDRGIITPPAVFTRQMDMLTHNGFTPITDDALYAHLTADAPLPAKPILITLDDGSESQVTNAVPILERHHFPATFFLMTVVFDKRQWISTPQVRMLQATGFTVAAHTYDHHPVTKYKGNDFATQLVAPRADLTKIVGRPVVDFAYPYGSWNHSSLSPVKAAGYRMAFGLDTPADPTDPLRSYPRVIVPPTWSEAQLLAAIAHAAHPTANNAAAGGE